MGSMGAVGGWWQVDRRRGRGFSGIFHYIFYRIFWLGFRLSQDQLQLEVILKPALLAKMSFWDGS